MTDIKLNQLIEWTAKDRAKGECPVPAGSDVTVWFSNGDVLPCSFPQILNWEEERPKIKAYLVHSVPREPIVRWLVVGCCKDELLYKTKEKAEEIVSSRGGRVFKMVEKME